MIQKGFGYALGILVYVGIVATIMENGERLFGKMENIIGPITFLLLFTTSALVVGSLALGKPIMLYLDNKKKEAVGLLVAIVGWLAVFTLVALIVATTIK